MARLSSELVLSLTDRVSGSARAIDRNLDNLERRQGRFGRASRLAAEETVNMSRAQSRLLAGVASVLPPVAVAAGGQQIVRAAADFETALTNIQKKAGATAAETAKLGEEIKALATSGELAVPIEEIAAAYERGAAAGIPLNELREFASLSAKAADAFEMSATDVGNAAAGFKTVQGIPINQMQRYFDLINGLADAGIADESGIVDYIDQGGAMAKTFGFTAEQTAALGAALANLKVSASKGATATNSILTKLLAPDALSGPARQAYNRVIKDDKRFRRQLASGKSAEAFVEIIDSLKAMNKEQRTGLIADLFGQDHLDVMTQLVEGSDEVKRNLAFAAGDSWFGSLDKSYALKLDDFWSQWQLAKNALEKLMIDVGGATMPALKSALEGAVSLIGEVEKGIGSFKAEVDMTAIDAAAASVGELQTQVASLLGMKGEGSHIQTFFRDLAGVVNEVAGLVKGVSDGFRDIADFANDPSGYMKSRAEMSDREMKDRYGITRLDQDEVNDRVERQDRRRNTDHARARGERRRTLQSSDGAGAAYTRNQMYLRGELTPDDYRRQDPERAFATAERLGFNRHRQGETNGLAASYFRRQTGESERQLSEAMIGMPESAKAGMQAYAAAIAASGGQVTDEARAIANRVRDELARIAPSAPPVPTGTVERGALGPVPTSGGPPIPTPRPNIEAPVRDEAERAALAAEAAGLRIGDALSVSARPNVDTSAIDTATAKAERLARILERIPGLATRASAAANAAQADYSGIHATIER